MINQRIAQLRALMAERGIDAYLVPTDDFHCSEYVGDHFKCRKYITGFTGSAGTALITMDEAGLWTDGRYFLQAGEQLKETCVTLFKSGMEGVPTIEEYLDQKMANGQCLGFDGRVMTARQGTELEKQMDKKGVSVACHQDLIGEIWSDRPALSCEPAWELDVRYAGQSRSDKLSLIRKKMKEKEADYFLLTSLDDICWLLNIRGNDIACTPVVLSYLLMTEKEVLLFAQKKAFPEDLIKALAADGVALHPYDEIYTCITEIPAENTLLLDPSSANYTLKKSVPEGVTILEADNLTLDPKAVKNPVEAANMREAHIQDGVAVTRFIYWLKHQVGKEKITELSAAEKLEEFRRERPHYLGPSFTPIIGYGPHGAIVHYSATEESDAVLENKSLVLADTGGHYMEGSTDITRTIALGETTQKEKEFFTRVLRGNLNLAAAKFLYGSCSTTFDYLARQPLWEIGEDYNHGTGHGIGYLLNVHEGPNSFYYKATPTRRNVTFEEGMITSDEPGYYAEGEFGIRHENLILCKKAEKTAAGQFMEFETLTMVPFDLDAVLPEEMTSKERALLNTYHRKVYETIAPFLNEEEAAWLKEATREI